MRYVVRQKIFSLGDSFSIKDEFGNDVFMARRQLFTFGKKLRIYDLFDNELCYIEQKIFKFLPEYNIFMGDQHVANVKKKLAFLKNDFVISSPDAQYYIDGNLWAREFNIFRDGRLVAVISKAFFSFTDTYGVDIDDAEDQVRILALAIVLDMVCHDQNN